MWVDVERQTSMHSCLQTKMHTFQEKETRFSPQLAAVRTWLKDFNIQLLDLNLVVNLANKKNHVILLYTCYNCMPYCKFD